MEIKKASVWRSAAACLFFLLLIILGQRERPEVIKNYLKVNNPIVSNNVVSLVATFPGSLTDWRSENIEKTYKTIKDAGVKISYLYYSWGELEKSRGSYDWGNFDYNLDVIKENGLTAALTIKIINTNNLGELPSGVNFTSFDDPVFAGRFKSFVMTLLQRREGTISYLFIGNEIDGYLRQHNELIAGYAKLYKEVYDEVKIKYPDIKIGTVSAYHDAKKNNALDIIKIVGREGDIIGFSLYPQMLGDDPADTPKYIEEMSTIAMGINKKFAVTESGWSTSGMGGSRWRQTQFIKELFSAYRKNKDSMEYLGLFNLHDFPRQINKMIATDLGLEGAGLIKWQGSLGLAYNDGTPKPAWNAFLEEMSK